MNKAITDGLNLMPPAFDEGLGLWSRENGTAGSGTYAGATNAAIVAADQDFGSCLELSKTQATQKLRYMGQTPMIPGCYLRISARVKVVSGNLPAVRIAGYAMSGTSHVNGVVEVGPSTPLQRYGSIVTVSAIVGTGKRGGVDMTWGTVPTYGFFGLDLTGQNGGVVRVENMVIEDVTDVFVRDMMDWVDVRDYGAVGDGVTNDRDAFLAADAATNGRKIVVPAGEYYIGSSMAISSPIRFTGTLKMPTGARLSLLRSYDFPTYAEAFGDETVGLKKAMQALFGYTDHNMLDLKGRRVDLTEPLDMGAIAPDITSFSNRRVLCNGQINVVDGPAWQSRVVTTRASYSTTNPTQLTGVEDITNIAMGSRVEGVGVGREIYVRAVDVASGSLTLSQPLFGGAGTRSYKFTRDRYILDFSGIPKLDRFNIDDVEFLCNGVSSAIMLPPTGQMNQLRDCYVNRPKDKSITSIGRGCQDLLVDRCQFLSNESPIAATDRVSVALNVNANDSKIRESRFMRFRHTMLLNGTGHLIVGNHWFQGDEIDGGPRLPGLVFCQPNVQSTVTGNYIDNCSIEWTNEYSPNPVFGNEYSFGGLTVTGNTFVCSRAADWFAWISVKPYGAGHFVHGFHVTGNVFRTMDGMIDRIDREDTTYAELDKNRMRNVVFEDNSYNGIRQMTVNPVVLQVDQATAQTVWTVKPGDWLPFGGWARKVQALVAENKITTQGGTAVSTMPYVAIEQGADRKNVTLNWSEAARGRMQVTVRMDTPN